MIFARYYSRVVAALLLLALCGGPAAALAQAAPSDVPSYASPDAAGPANNDEETIHGKIASIDGADALQLNDDRGFVDSVQLQQDTIINPNGTRLQPGMAVTIGGAARGNVFAASHIDVAFGPSAPQAQPPVQQMPAPAPAPPPPDTPDTTYVQPDRVPLGPGTELTGILRTSLDSKTATVGQPVMLHDVFSGNRAIAGASLLGEVTDVQHPGQGRNAQVLLHFDSLRMPDGTITPIDGIVAQMNVKTKSNAAKEVGGAVIGMLVGNALGKTLLGVGGGGIIGAFGGYLVAKDNRSDVEIPADTEMTVRIVQTTRRQAP
jgi:hypothetical protein